MNKERQQSYIKALGIPVWRQRSPVQSVAEEVSAVASEEVSPSDLLVLPEEQGNLCIQKINIDASLSQDDTQINSPHVCQLCARSETRVNMVIARGNPKARVMVIVESPTFDEELAGKPLAGKAETLFSEMLATIGLSLNDLYITPYVKCRSAGIKDPTMTETMQCRTAYLESEVDMVNPELIILLGRNTARSLLSIEKPFDELRGHVHFIEINHKKYATITTYAPNLLLRLPGEKAKAWRDIKTIYRELHQ